VHGIFDLKHWYLILVLSVVLPFVSVLGDFVFSSAKRYFEIKDFGNIMPGHGGALDRIDSVVFTMLTTAVYISLIQYWAQFVS
jgi:phosphatidate cytidylyltransferase